VTVGVGANNTDAAGQAARLTAVPIDPGESLTFGFVPLSGTEVVYALCNTANGATVTLGLVTGP
jgi:urease beta subunit